jgi:hypothetical protein
MRRVCGTHASTWVSALTALLCLAPKFMKTILLRTSSDANDSVHRSRTTNVRKAGGARAQRMRETLCAAFERTCEA